MMQTAGECCGVQIAQHEGGFGQSPNRKSIQSGE